MIYLTYNQNSGGRSGHKLKDIMSLFIFSFFIKNSICCSHPSWKFQKILKIQLEKSVADIKYDTLLKINNFIEWNGISYEKFKEIITSIKNNHTSGKNLLVEFSNVCRIHPSILHNWYIEKLIHQDTFNKKFLPLIKKFYYGIKTPVLKNQISIHVRRGDIAKKIIKSGFDKKYYSNIINSLNKYCNIPICIFSENENSEDLLELRSLKNTTIFLGGEDDIKNHFYQMVTSKFLILSASSFSTWTAYLSIGKVFYQKKIIKHFNHLKPPANFFEYDKTLDPILNKIKGEPKFPFNPS
jgi:hypothetical protein